MGVSENELSHHFQLKSISWRFPKSWGYPLNHPCYVQIFHYKPTILSSMDPPHLQRCPGTNCGKSSSNPLSNCCTSGRRAINPCRWCVFSRDTGKNCVHRADFSCRVTCKWMPSHAESMTIMAIMAMWRTAHIWIHDHPRMKWIWNGMQIEKH